MTRSLAEDSQNPAVIQLGLAFEGLSKGDGKGDFRLLIPPSEMPWREDIFDRVFKRAVEHLAQLSHEKSQETRARELEALREVFEMWIAEYRDIYGYGVNEPTATPVSTIDLLKVGDDERSIDAADSLNRGLENLFLSLGPPPDGLLPDVRPELVDDGGSQR
ncbi:hypothetical protein GCM10009546_66180 [Actinomadura livida]|nr:hypothetical protein GCM10010208_23860 [Actinomadura livida]